MLREALQHSFCWFNGKLIPINEAKISLFDHGLLYGDGVFEGLRFYNRQPFRLAMNLKRLHQSLVALELSIPFEDEELVEGVNACIAAAPQDSGYLRLVVTRGEGNLGLNPKSCPLPNVFIVSADLEIVDERKYREGIHIITSTIKRAVGTGLDSRIKTLNYLHSIMARIEANVAEADEALLLNQFGNVAECCAENIFIIKDGVLLTPPCTDGALAGITRQALIDIANEIKLENYEKTLTPYDVYTADEVFICGSGARMIPVGSLDNKKIAHCPGDVFLTIQKRYGELIAQECGV